MSKVYPRVCGGTCYGGQNITRESCRTVYPRVCGGTVQYGGRSNVNQVTVYPRVCGGTAIIVSPSEHPNGLSPRVRGNPAVAFWQGDAHRSIPACAGEPLPC